MSQTFLPEVLWAQHTDEIYITINLSDITYENLKLSETSLTFNGESHSKQYQVAIEFYGDLSRWIYLKKRIFTRLQGNRSHFKKNTGTYKIFDVCLVTHNKVIHIKTQHSKHFNLDVSEKTLQPFFYFIQQL